MVINLAPASLSNKKVNLYTCPRLTFLKKNATENAYKSISEPLAFKILWGACPQSSLAARAFGARNLPCLVPKSGYVWTGPLSGSVVTRFILAGCDSFVLPLNLIDILKSEKQTNRVLELYLLFVIVRRKDLYQESYIHSKNFKKSFLSLF